MKKTLPVCAGLLILVAGCARRPTDRVVDISAIRPEDVVSISSRGDPELLLALPPLDGARWGPGVRDLRLWGNTAFSPQRLLRLSVSPDSGASAEWWVLWRMMRVTTRDGVVVSEPRGAADARCEIVRRNQDAGVCRLGRMEGEEARALIARVDSLRSAALALQPVLAPGLVRIQLDGSSLEVEGWDDGRRIAHRFWNSDLRSDSAAAALHRMTRSSPR